MQQPIPIRKVGQENGKQDRIRYCGFLPCSYAVSIPTRRSAGQLLQISKTLMGEMTASWPIRTTTRDRIASRNFSSVASSRRTSPSPERITNMVIACSAIFLGPCQLILMHLYFAIDIPGGLELEALGF